MIILIYNSFKNFKKKLSMEMSGKGYSTTDWIFFFDEKSNKNLNDILTNDKNKGLKEEFITWKLITVFLPLLTFLLVVLLNLLTIDCKTETFYGFVNNGSLPIISFGIITSGMPYLLEQLQNFPDFQATRRRVMAISLFFLFLSASLYILQTLSIISNQFTNWTRFVLLVISIYIFLFSCSIGYKMFLLQSKNIKDFDEEIKDNLKGLNTSVDDLE